MNSSGPGRYGDSKSRAGVDDLFLLCLEGRLNTDFLLSAPQTPQTLTNIRQPSNTTATAPVWKAAVVAKRNLRSRAQPVATCQMLDTIEEVNEDSQAYPNFDFSETESEAADLCEILDENSDLGIDEPLIDLAADQT